MDVNLAAGDAERRKPSFPYSNWGAALAVSGLLLAVGSQFFFALPLLFVDPDLVEDPTPTATAILQLLGAAAFMVVPMAVAAMRGSAWRLALKRLGVRGFHRSAFGWMSLAVFAYLFFAAVYVALIGEPEQKDIAEAFGPLPVQILLVVFAASISEELFFRGFLFGGLRERLPRLAAALLSGAIFGGLHAVSGISAVPPLIFFGFVLALLYEKTGSIVPCVLLHMLNNSAALLTQ